MKRQETGTPYLSWCLIARNTERTLEACLQSIRERTPEAEIVVVDTMSSDRSPEIAQKYADVWVEWTGPRGEWNREMPWFDDAAAARQHAFELASGRWRAWADCDDRIAGPEEAEKLLKLNNQWKPQAGRGTVVNGHTEPVGLIDLLKEIDADPEKFQGLAYIWAPYLYRRDEHGHAMIWQVRERIVRWDDPPKFRWQEAAHEVLVPVPGYAPPRAEFSHLLFVHEKQFSDEDFNYAVARHFDVLHKQYQLGGDARTPRRCLYLAEYAKMVCPARELEFIHAAHETSITPLDRYRALLQRGIYYASRGLFFDAEEALGAATFLRGDLPDAWLCGAIWWQDAGDHAKAVDWFERALLLPLNPIESYVAPRDLAVRYPAMLVESYREVARRQILASAHLEAQGTLEKAVRVMMGVRDSDAVGMDKLEAQARLIIVDNEAKAQAEALHLASLAKYLLDNDESQKAVALLRAVPWNVQDHPLVAELEAELAPVVTHLTDETAYQAFYASIADTGAIASPEVWLDPATCTPRARWLGDWIATNAPRATIVDVGCFDGVVSIALLKMCPSARYTGVDISAEAVARLNVRLAEHGLADRARGLHGSYTTLIAPGTADVVIWTEVIEHVPDPRAEIEKLGRLLKPGGHLLMSTPWGSFDHGHPPDKTDHGTPRGHRGHVRALTARDVARIVDSAEPGFTLQDLWKATPPIPIHLSGTEMGIVVQKTPAAPRRLAFSVPGALWNWNSRKVHAEGMGASEETIVYLAKALAQAGDATVEVFTPSPHDDIYTSAEVHHGVRYWPRAQLRHLREQRPARIIVSRSPLHGQDFTQEALGYAPQKILWLQDAYYPDLNPTTAAGYEKIVVVSNWHKDMMHLLHGVPLDQMVVHYNFILPEHFTGAAADVAWALRKRDHFIYASSPDRGLLELLRAWPRIREKLPDATLSIFYGWKGCTRLGGMQLPDWTKRFQEIRREYETLRWQPGVQDIGMVDHVRLAQEFMRAGVWGYFTKFDETGCCNAVKARAGGAIPVCTPRAALVETAACEQGFFVPENDEDSFVSACVAATQVDDAARKAMSEEAIATYGLPAILPSWRELLL